MNKIKKIYNKFFETIDKAITWLVENPSVSVIGLIVLLVVYLFLLQYVITEVYPFNE